VVKEKYGELFVLHQNVQSISNDVVELDLALKANLGNIDVLCYTEHWVKEDYLNLIQFNTIEAEYTTAVNNTPILFRI
jgi:hypothetical protein